VARKRTWTPAVIRGQGLQAEAPRLRGLGWSYPQIAGQLAVSQDRVGQLVRNGMRDLARVSEADAKELRAVEREALAALWKIAWEHAKEGDSPGWFDRALRVRESHRKLMGLDLTAEPYIDARTQNLVITTRELEIAGELGKDPDNVAVFEKWGRGLGAVSR
jgi:hypothetical protein